MEAPRVYNCIAWTVGLSDRWLWPGGDLAGFDTFYRGFGFTYLIATPGNYTCTNLADQDEAQAPLTTQDIQDENGVRWQIEQMHRELKQLTGTEKCQCRKARSQRNPLACCYLAWVALRVRAKQIGATLYETRANLFRDFLMAQLRKPSIPAYGVA